MNIAHYHAHVYFETSQLELASQLHRELAARFPVTLGRLFPMPIGPHSKGMFQVLLPKAQFAPVVEWLLLNRQGLDVLVHAVSGDDLKDHTEYAMWLGQSLPLKLDAL